MDTRKLSLFAGFTIALVMAVPLSAVAKDKHKGGRGGRHSDQSSRKCEKFVNCHDASEGRWDGKGPKRERFEDRFDRRRRFADRDFDDFDWRRMQRRRLRYDRYRDGWRGQRDGWRDRRDGLRGQRGDYYNRRRSSEGSNWNDAFSRFFQ